MTHIDKIKKRNLTDEEHSRKLEQIEKILKR